MKGHGIADVVACAYIVTVGVGWCAKLVGVTTEGGVSQGIGGMFGLGGGCNGGKARLLSGVDGELFGRPGTARSWPDPSSTPAPPQELLEGLEFVDRDPVALDMAGGVKAASKTKLVDEPLWAHLESAIPIYSVSDALVGKVGSPCFS